MFNALSDFDTFEKVFKEIKERNEINSEDYKVLFIQGLKINKSDVIEVLLENGIYSFDFKEANFELNRIKYFNRKKDPIILYLQKQMRDSKMDSNDLFDYQNDKIKFNHYRRLEEVLFPKTNSIKIFDRNMYEGDGKGLIEHETDEMYLFFWCILTNRVECAKVLWKFGKVRILIIFLE